jgi:hypothetical protein
LCLNIYYEIEPYINGAGKKPNKFRHIIDVELANALNWGCTDDIIIPII